MSMVIFQKHKLSGGFGFAMRPGMMGVPRFPGPGPWNMHYNGYGPSHNGYHNHNGFGNDHWNDFGFGYPMDVSSNNFTTFNTR